MPMTWNRLINGVYTRTPIGKNLTQLPVGVRIAQETFLLTLLRHERYSDPRHLAHFERNVYSQNGEDGVIAEIFRRIGVRDRTFLEMGVGDGLENNSAFPLSQGWSGWWVDGDAKSLNRVRRVFARQLAGKRLHLQEMFITAENIAGALQGARVPDELDLFSLDLDRNTFWIWNALPNLRPRVLVVEYNATMPPEVDWKVEYDAGALWDGSLNYGASLKAFEELGRGRGYSLVYCDLSGTNAFFVRDDLRGDQFAGPFDAVTHYEPPRYWLQRTSGHPRSESMFGRESP